ncbi:MAG: hypothetical protein IE933_10105 [Sphingomonadales bacterium]|nr:hypothetical protein [Sphingomonadales bacterium]MBD3773310.1 hypothetical protein [Paracoccaceae bacterium]MBD3813832.1 hypothetical protein [Betaproteobacteria bacterium]
MAIFGKIATGALAASLALGLAAPSMAHDRYDGQRDDRGYGSADYDYGRYQPRARALLADINRLGYEVRTAEDRGLIRYAPQFREQLRQINYEYERSARHGFTEREVWRVQQHVDSLRRSLRIYIARGDRYDRRDRYGYGYGRR